MAQINSMQQEAMRRVQQMYSGAQTSQNQNNQKSDKKGVKNKPPEQPSIQTPVETIEQHTDVDVPVSNTARHNESLLDIFMKDKEKSLIILLIVILANDGADTSLLLALMYLII